MVYVLVEEVIETSKALVPALQGIYTCERWIVGWQLDVILLCQLEEELRCQRTFLDKMAKVSRSPQNGDLRYS